MGFSKKHKWYASENDDDHENITYKRQGTKVEDHYSYQWGEEVKQSQIRINQH